MGKIVRRPDRAEGGITDAERAAMAECVRNWTANAFQTVRTDREALKEAIVDLYATANLPPPIVVVVPSPLVMALAGGIAEAWWDRNLTTDAATYAATSAATDAATRVATYEATYAATDEATYAATRVATYAATDEATYAATRVATYEATRVATDEATDEATRVATRVATYAATRGASASHFEAHFCSTSACSYFSGNSFMRVYFHFPFNQSYIRRSLSRVSYRKIL